MLKTTLQVWFARLLRLGSMLLLNTGVLKLPVVWGNCSISPFERYLNISYVVCSLEIEHWDQLCILVALSCSDLYLLSKFVCRINMSVKKILSLRV